MLLEEFLIPMGLTQRQLAEAIHVPYQRVNDFWMNLQLRWDLYFAQQDEKKVLEQIHTYSS
jgi:plasmid maintenance system antidote protein VapI